MNYERIYNEFILDRREKEKSLRSETYTETHHIIPKYMDGNEDKENLIRLTPEDHFFAHLLLAKSFGDKNWIPLNRMLHRGARTEEISYKDFRKKRKHFGFVRRMVANSYKSRNNSEVDTSKYILLNKDGRKIEGDRAYISQNTELSSRLIGRLIRGKINTAHNWYYPKFNPQGLTTAEKNVKEPETFTLFHFDGREWMGNKKEFVSMTGKVLSFQTEDGMCQGWFKIKEKAEEYLQRRIVAGSLDRRIFEFEIIKSKKKIYHSKSSFKKEFNVSEGQINDLLFGKITKLKGVKIIEKNYEDRRAYGKYYSFLSIKTNEKYKMSIPQMAKKLGADPNVVSRLVKGKVKVLKKYGITLA